MSHFESPEHCYDFPSVVKCFSPLNCWLVLDSDIKVLTLEMVRMNLGQQKRSPQQHRSSLSFTPVGGWRAPGQHNLELPIPKSWGSQWRIAHRDCLKSQCQVGMWLHWQSPAPHPLEWGWISGCCHPLSPAPTATAAVCSKFILAQVKCQATTCELLIKELFK